MKCTFKGFYYFNSASEYINMKVHVFNYRICTVFNPESHLLSIQWFNGDDQKATVLLQSNESTDTGASQSPIHLIPIKSRVPWSCFLYSSKSLQHPSASPLLLNWTSTLEVRGFLVANKVLPQTARKDGLFFSLKFNFNFQEKKLKKVSLCPCLGSQLYKESARNGCMGNGTGLENLHLINTETIQSKIS